MYTCGIYYIAEEETFEVNRRKGRLRDCLAINTEIFCLLQFILLICSRNCVITGRDCFWVFMNFLVDTFGPLSCTNFNVITNNNRNIIIVQQELLLGSAVLLIL